MPTLAWQSDLEIRTYLLVCGAADITPYRVQSPIVEHFPNQRHNARTFRTWGVRLVEGTIIKHDSR